MKSCKVYLGVQVYDISGKKVDKLVMVYSAGFVEKEDVIEMARNNRENGINCRVVYSEVIGL